jgi:adenine phosphoribosyltransferase
MTQKLKKKIRTIPNWPKKGIMFRDITTLLKDAKSFNQLIDLFYERYKSRLLDLVVGIESRGFIIGSALAHRLGVGFVPIRKAGKLPAAVFTEEYDLEYGKDKIEMHKDAIKKGHRVLLVDDLIATGGTALAACKLIEKAKGELIECAFLIDLSELGGKRKLCEAGYKVFNLIEFEGE